MSFADDIALSIQVRATKTTRLRRLARRLLRKRDARTQAQQEAAELRGFCDRVELARVFNIPATREAFSRLSARDIQLANWYLRHESKPATLAPKTFEEMLAGLGVRTPHGS